MDQVCYCTREDVMRAVDVKNYARINDQVDRAIRGATSIIESGTFGLNRKFYPLVATRYFDWPNDQQARAWRLYFNQYECISITSITTGGITLNPGDYFLEPANSGPPYRRIEMNLASVKAFSGGNTFQRSIVINGLWGYNADEEPAGSMVTANISSSATSFTVSNSAIVGVGNILRIGTERMIVTEKSMVTTAQTGSISANNADQALTVADGTQYAVGETLLLDQERVRVADIAGNVLTVQRAQDGTVLAAHTAATIFALRALTVTRGALGTTAAAQTAGALVKHVVPPLVRNLAVAESINTLEQEGAAYARTVGSGDNLRPAPGAGLADIRRQAQAAHARQGRQRVV